MELDNFIFTPPPPSYTSTSLDNLIWIPRTRLFSMKRLVKDIMKQPPEILESEVPFGNLTFNQKMIRIPCHYQKLEKDCKNIIVYFHAGTEDIGMNQVFARRISVGLKANVLSIEYPGYGIYEGKPDLQKILEDAEILYDFLSTEVGIKPESIIIMGRSLGCAPAIHLSATRNVKMLTLISPFSSLQSFVKQFTGPLLCKLVTERFNNLKEIQKVKCPVCFIHGKNDKLIPTKHSQLLKTLCNSKSKLYIPKTMSHNNFSVISDIIPSLRSFLIETGLFNENEPEAIRFPDYVTYSLEIPTQNHFRITSLISKFVGSIMNLY